MLIIKIVAGLVFIVLAGCAGVSDIKDNGLGVANDVKESRKSVKADKITEISPEVLYLLMTAEIAGQRNQYGVALDGYLQAAKRVDDVRVAERAAKIGLFLKDTKKTDEAVSLWLKQDGENLTARKIAALSALKGNNKKLAVEHLNKILADDPAGFEATLLELTRLLGKEGKADFIFNVLEDIGHQHPKQASVFFVQALLAGQLNRPETVKEKVNETLALQPDWDKALILRAQVFAQTGKLDKARLDLERVLEKNPQNIKIRKMLGKVLMKADALDEAIEAYQKVLETAPEDGESQFAIAIIYLQQKKEDDALDYLKKLVNRPGWDAQASFYIGRIAFKNKQYEKALTWFDKVTQGPYEYDSAVAAISVLLSQKEYKEAEQRLAKMPAKFPRHQLNIALLKAEIYSEQNQYQKAFDLLTEVLADYPGHRDLLYTRALIAEKIDRLDVLEHDLKKILSKKPDDAAVLNALGYTLADRTNRYDEAGKYLQKALKLNPEEAVIMDSMGWLLFKQGRMAESLGMLRTAYEKLPENEIAAHLAEILWVMGRKAEARDVFNKALINAPEDEYLLKLKKRISGIDDK